MEGEQIISGEFAWEQWLDCAAGKFMLDWEQEQLDAVVADVFGYIALQCGLAQIDGLRANRMPSKVLAIAGASSNVIDSRSVVRISACEALPFDSQSLDLVVLPHVLEYAIDPHQTLREVERVLRPEGRLIITGFNPVSLWGARQLLSRGPLRPFLPAGAHLIGYPRLRDWLKLLGFELERGRYGCFRPPCRTQRWLDRTEFLERAGDRWWPICGAVYLVCAVKRVQSMRLVGKLWRAPVAKRSVLAARRTPLAHDADTRIVRPD